MSEQGMKVRLDRLRVALGFLTWGELAEALNISRSMLGFINTGVKKPGPKLSQRIHSLERTVDHEDATKQLLGEIALLRKAIDDLRKQLSETAAK